MAAKVVERALTTILTWSLVVFLSDVTGQLLALPMVWFLVYR